MTKPDSEDGETGALVTRLVPMVEQIGGHVMEALKAPDAVAVLTTLVPGVEGDRLVSLKLCEDQLAHVGALLAQLKPEPEKDEEEVKRCIGFQCRIDESDKA
ncbi:MAG: hypothetical protein ACON5B_12895 [Myxococcota bacterium]